MNLLSDPWIPVRADNGMGAFRLLTLEELLCSDGDWWVSIPRDDLEMACIQLLVCMVQTMFMPENDAKLREWLRRTLDPRELADGAKPCQEWFDLGHPIYPFMQTRGVKAAEITPIQKLLVGLPEGNNHAFFNEVGEVEKIGSAIAAIALFNQASNSPSFGGGFKGSLRGGAPISTLVKGRNLRETIWRNVVTLSRVQDRLPRYEYDLSKDRPTWVDPMHVKQVIHSHEIGLVRGLFWQPARVELIRAVGAAPCDLLGDKDTTVYTGFRKEKFNYTIEGLWPHPHGAMTAEKKKGIVEWKFASFTKTAPAWTWLSEFVVPSPLSEDEKEGATPAAPVNQASEVFPGEPLHLLVGGYRSKQAAVVERRHELFTLAEGWEEERKGRVKALVEIGKAARSSLRGKLWFAARGDKDKGMKGIGVAVHEIGDKLFYALTEELFHETLREQMTFKVWKKAKEDFAERLSAICGKLYDEITEPYSMKPELIPVIAWSRRSLNSDLRKLIGGAMP